MARTTKIIYEQIGKRVVMGTGEWQGNESRWFAAERMEHDATGAARWVPTHDEERQRLMERALVVAQNRLENARVPYETLANLASAACCLIESAEQAIEHAPEHKDDDDECCWCSDVRTTKERYNEALALLRSEATDEVDGWEPFDLGPFAKTPPSCDNCNGPFGHTDSCDNYREDVAAAAPAGKE